MMAESIYFDIGSFPPASLRLVSGNGLVPLTLPVPLNGSAERFRQLMESDVRQTVASIRSAVEMPDVTRPAAEGRVVVEDVAVARPHNTVIVDVPPPAADDVLTPSLPSITQPTVESRPIVEARPAVDRPAVDRPVVEPLVVGRPFADVKPVVGAEQVTEATPVAEARSAAEGRVVLEDVAVARPHNTVIVDVPPPAADDVATPSLPSITQPTVESRPIVEARPAVDRPVVEPLVVGRPFADVKPVAGAKQVTEATPVAEAQPAAEGRVVVEDVAVARPHNTVIVDVPPQAADDVATPSLPSVVPVTAESQPAVESRPVVESSPIVESKPVVEVPVAEKRLVADDPVTELRIVEPTVSETPVSKPKMSTKRGPVDAPLHAAPVSVSVAPATPMAVAQPDIVKQANAATARIEVVVETVEQIVETVVDRIFATPSLAQGEGEIRIMLRPTVLDGSELSISAKDGTLTVSVAPATPEAARVVAFALPRLETALVEHAPAFHHVAVVLATVKKGKNNEAA